MAQVIRMDTNPDAVDLARVLQAEFGKACRERPTLGPISVLLRHKDVAIVAGPFRRKEGKLSSAGDCQKSKRWADEILAAIPR